jgi:CrcB protein
LVGAGGFLGSVARYVASRTIGSRLDHLFPFGTFIVNITGCFLLGIVIGLTTRHGTAGDSWRAFLGIGFCGGYTTFSTFAMENFNLLDQKLAATAALYIMASVACGIMAALAGLWCTRFL